MKKSLVAAGLGIILSLSAFATTGKDNAKALQHFTSTFAGAQNVRWKTISNFSEVEFTWAGQAMAVFYSNADGQYVATTRKIDFNALPISTITAIREQYAGYTITEGAEIEHVDDGLSYYVSLENGKKKIILKANGSGGLDVFSKEKIK